ncbi:MAG: anthrone oxygenase family protein [Pseudomonadota bacterium]|nr:anthrone oxygenase family protein [Pseudomonadota bacterium]
MTAGRIAALAAMLMTALMAGFFLAFSICVMWGLDDVAPAAAIEAMQGINRAVRNPVFFVLFFLTPFVGAIAALLALRARKAGTALLLLLGAVVYAGGVIVPTAVVNVPMNEALAALGAVPAADAPAIWRDYSDRWTAWNHLRTALNILALLLVAMGWRGIGRG